jgi:LDH2 family malate/lactate/ureidoglycolate dehydrogenase
MTQPLSAPQRIVRTVRESGFLWTASLVLDRLLPIGILGWWRDRCVPAEILARQLEAIFTAWGMSEEHVAVTVEHVLYADLHGIDSHGCAMLLHYERELHAGLLTMTPAIAVVQESATTALIDGGGGLGHVPAVVAMELAITKCREAGVAAVGVKNSGHFGAAGAYAAMAAEAGLLGFATTNTRVPAVVPTFAAEARLGTNPIAFAAPAARNPPFLLDMATSTASLGTLTTAWRKGRSLPTGWALDDAAAPETSARRGALGRRLTPLGSSREMGSHKGYGLAAAMEILSSVMTGSSRAIDGVAGEIGHFFLAIDPQRFRAAGDFAADLDVLVDSLHGSKRADAGQPVLVAGDPERAALEERRQHGIPLARSVVEDLRAIANACGAPFLLDGES